MTQDQYFRGIAITRSTDIPDKELINKTLENKNLQIYNIRFGFYIDCYYYLNKSGRLTYTVDLPPKGKTEITFQEFKDWLLDIKSVEPHYEVY